MSAAADMFEVLLATKIRDEFGDRKLPFTDESFYQIEASAILVLRNMRGDGFEFSAAEYPLKIELASAGRVHTIRIQRSQVYR